MTPDYDLTNLQIDQVDLWIYLQVDVILARILADQIERRTSPLALGDCTQLCSPHCACEAAGGTQQSKTGSGPIGVGLGN